MSLVGALVALSSPALALRPQGRREPPPLRSSSVLRIDELLTKARRDEGLGLFDEAAEGYEALARGESGALGDPGEAGAWLARAVELRLGLGHEREALADEQAHERLLRGRTPASELRVALAMARHLADRERWGEAQARLRRADALLPLHGSAAQRSLARSLSLRALAATDDRRAAAEAKRLAKAPPGPRAKVAPDETFEALFFLAEKERARAEAVAMPPFTDRMTRDEVLAWHHLAAPWLRRRSEAIQRAAEAYQQVVDRGAPARLVIASAARVGALWGAFVDELRRMPLAPPPRLPGVVPDEWRRLLDAHTDPIDALPRQHARQAFVACLDQALAHRHHDENVEACEDWLARHQRAEFTTGEGYRATASLTPRVDEPSSPHFSSHRWPQRLP